MLKLQPVDANYVSQIWHLVEPFLRDALEKGGEACGGVECYNIHQVQMFLSSGQWLLIVATDDDNEIHGAATVSFINYPQQRVAFMTLTGGKFIANPEIFDQFKQIVKSRGATVVHAYVRKSMQRLLDKSGFKPLTTLVEAKI